MYYSKPLPVRTKLQFSQRYRNGEFGNASPTWDTLSDYEWAYLEGKITTDIHIRNRVAGGPGWYHVPSWAVRKTCKELIGDDLRSFYFSQMAPTECTLFQGEVQRSYRHLDLYYATTRKTMREAISAGDMQQVHGIVAERLLQHYLPTKDYEWLMYLLDIYVDHVVEFSTYSVEWGTVPGYRTVYWETRLY